MSISATSTARLVRRWLHLAYLLPIVYFLRPVFWEPLDHRFYDLFHSKRHVEGWTDVVVVAIDESTRGDVLARPVFPLSKHTGVYAELTSRLKKAGARAIVFDLPFSEDTLPEPPRELAEAFTASGDVFLIMSLLEKPNVDSSGEESTVFRGIVPHPDLVAASNGAFVDGLSIDHDGVLRRLRPNPQLDPLGLELLPERLARFKVREPIPIEFPSLDQSIPVVSCGDLLEGEERAVSSISGRIAFVGALLDESAHYLAVPRLQALADGRSAFQLPRVKALAAATETLLLGAPTRDVNAVLTFLWNLLWCLIVLTVIVRRHALLAALLLVALLVLSLAATSILHIVYGMVLPGGLLLGCVFVSGLHSIVFAHIESLKEHRVV